MPNPTVNLTTGQPAGTIEDGQPFDFTISSPAPNEITIIGKNEHGSNLTWFTSNPYPAVIPTGSTSVTVTAAMESGQQNPWFTYLVTGMVYAQNVHIVVGGAMPAAKKAS
jgi:hypothetical protein